MPSGISTKRISKIEDGINSIIDADKKSVPILARAVNLDVGKYTNNGTIDGIINVPRKKKSSKPKSKGKKKK